MGILAENNTLLLFGPVGGDIFFDDGFDARDVIDALAVVGRSTDVTVKINSGGGIASEGVAIFNALKAHRGKVTVSVEAVAASAASLIAMAGETISMRKGSVLMVHDPAAITLGTAADHTKSVEMLEAVASSMADIYAEKTGKSPEEARADMQKELWLTAAAAVSQGYADTDEDLDADEVTAFNYKLYQNPPERLVAMAEANGWTGPKRRPPPAEMPKPKPQAPPVELVAEIARICAEASMPDMVETLLSEKGITAEIARQRVAYGHDVLQAVAIARKTCPLIRADAAETYIKSGASIEDIRSDLMNKIADNEGAEILGHHQPGDQAPPGTGLSTTDVWAKRQAGKGGRPHADQGDDGAPTLDASTIYARRSRARAAWPI